MIGECLKKSIKSLIWVNYFYVVELTAFEVFDNAFSSWRCGRSESGAQLDIYGYHRVKSGRYVWPRYRGW